MVDLIDRQDVFERLDYASWGNHLNKDAALNLVKIGVSAIPAVDAVVLPCKVGDTVYSKDGKVAEVEGFFIDKSSIYAGVSFDCDYNCRYCVFNSWYTADSGEGYCEGECGMSDVSIEQFGKTVFLSREEAEAALNGERREDDA